MFDVPKLADYAFSQIQAFSKLHPDETFYAFAIDASMLCLNTTDAFEKSLISFKTEYPIDKTDIQINTLKYNPGDWKYQGFADFRGLSTEDENGYPEGPFDEELYDKHYYLDNDAQKTSEYAIAMNAIIEILKAKDAFKCLKKTAGFRTGRVEHNY